MEQENKETDAESSGEGGAAPTKSKRKLFIIILAAVLIIAVVPAVLYFAGFFPGHEKAASETEADAENGQHGAAESESHSDGSSPASSDTAAVPVPMELDEFLVNLNTSGKQSRFLKMTIELELTSEKDKEAITPYIPRIRDSFQMYLRELRPEDLSGSAATYRLKEELMLRLVKVTYPIEVKDILFKDFIVQ